MESKTIIIRVRVIGVYPHFQIFFIYFFMTTRLNRGEGGRCLDIYNNLTGDSNE